MFINLIIPHIFFTIFLLWIKIIIEFKINMLINKKVFYNLNYYDKLYFKCQEYI